MNRTLPRRQPSCVQLFPNWGSFLSNLMRQWNITEITQFDSMREKKRQHFQVKLLGTFFNYFLKYFSYVSHKNSVSGSIKLFSLLLGKQEPLGRCSYKTFPRHTFITRKMFFFSEKWFFRRKAEDVFRSSFFYCFLPLHLLNSGIIYFFGNKFISP